MTFEARAALAAQAISRIASATRERLTAELDALIARYNAASDPAEKAKAAEGVERLLREAESVSEPGPMPIRWIILIGLVLVAYVGGIFFYLKGLGSPQYAEVEATRAVLVFTLIVAMLAFGGLLIVRPLFSAEDPVKLQERFRLAREVFMVFAGIFGTIIGFYFGTAGLAAADPPALGTPSFVPGKVSVEVRGGRRPFFADIILSPPNGDRRPMTLEGNTLSVTVPGTACPAGARIEVKDSEHRIAEAQLSCPAAGAGSVAQPPVGETVGNAAGNVAGNAT
ncbi:MAG TPA: hypothetical protein VJS15_04085 [Allosphingosinicella sp.]|nr:hypothetical protein [Allosphingosinicella sp.]